VLKEDKGIGKQRSSLVVYLNTGFDHNHGLGMGRRSSEPHGTIGADEGGVMFYFFGGRVAGGDISGKAGKGRAGGGIPHLYSYSGEGRYSGRGGGTGGREGGRGGGARVFAYMCI